MATTRAAVMLAVSAGMVMAGARARGMAVTLFAASGSGDSSNGTTTDDCNAILLQYADIVDVGSNDNGNCAPTINGGNIDRGVAKFNNGMRCVWGG
jgi:hypothetical protein